MTEHTDNEVKKYKRLSVILAIIAIILAVISIYSLTHVREYVVTAEQSLNAQSELQAELDSILQEYEAIKSVYGELNEQLTAKDSAILAQADEIQKLIATQGDYRRIKKKLELLQDQGKEYVKLLDALYTENENLTKENKGLAQEISNLHEEREGLISEKEQLESKVDMAARLKAHNVSLNGFTSKDKLTNKAKRVKTLQVSFTLSENQLTVAGEKNIYARISLPDGRVLAVGTGDAYSFINEGKRLQYTIKEVVNYENKSKQMNMIWTLREGDAAVAGKYHVQLFTDDNFIGEASLNLQ